MRRPTRMIAVIGLLAFCAAARAADPPYYVRKGTWQETMQASREALLRHEAQQASTIPGLAPGVRLGPWYQIGPFAQLSPDGFEHDFPPEKEIVLTKRYGRNQWRQTNDRDGEVHLLSCPGNAAIYLYRRIEATAPTALTGYFGSDDGLTVWFNGTKVISREMARGVSADQDTARLACRKGANHLLIKIWNFGGSCGWYFSTSPGGSRPARAKPDPRQAAREALWNLLRRDFRSPEARRQMAWERVDNIWAGDWKPADLAGLAQRYVLPAQGTAAGRRIQRLARRIRTPADLDSVRQMYYRAKQTQRVVSKAGDLNVAAVRLAVEDLTRTFGSKYAKGPEYLRRLAEIEKALAEADSAGDKDKKVQLAEALLQLRREALLANPLLGFERLLLVKRSMRSPRLGLPQNWQGNCALSRSGYEDELVVLDMKDPAAPLKTLFRPDPPNFVGDVDLHFDADRILFSSIGKNRRWQIFEIDAAGTPKSLRQVTPGEHDDVDNYDACYLPDGRIVFGSTRCFQGVPCVGGGSQVANLFLMDADGKNVRRLTFDQDHNWCPTVLPNGEVIYSRWEYSDTPHYFSRLLFHMNPDGTQQMEMYGSNSYWPNSIFYARPCPNHPTKIVAVISGHHGVARTGELIVFDPARGRHEADGAVQRIPGHGKAVEPIIRDGLVNGSWPRFLHPYPLSDKYFLVSCLTRGSSTWGLYLVDVFDNMLLLRSEPGYALFEPIPFRKTPRPRVIPDKVNLARKDAVVYLADVYAGRGLAGVPRGTVKKLRLYEFHYAYYRMGGHIHVGVDGPWDVHRIMGTVPVQPDGSAMFRVPANTPIAVQPLDKDGKALQIMRSWFTAMPGEILSCVGCHERQNDSAPNRRTLASAGKPHDVTPWYGPTRGFSFKREVQPVLDKYCVTCHDGTKKTPAGTPLPDFRLTDTKGRRGFTPSYLALHPYVRRPGPESDYHMMPPLEYHADTSELIQRLRKGHGRVRLDAEAWDRLITWIDLNVPDHGTWSEHRRIAGNIQERRLEMYRRYANLYRDGDPEDILPSQTGKIEPVPPGPPPKKPAPVAARDWPFDAAEAKRRQQAAAARLGLPADRGQAKTEIALELPGGAKLEMVLIPPGQFVMGDLEGWPDEWPQSPVRIDRPFWMGKFEITNAQYALFDPTHDSRYISVYNKDQGNRGQAANRERQPVIRVSWRQATAFCDWLSSQARPASSGQARSAGSEQARSTGSGQGGLRFSLPTEAQWEYACRAGTATAMNYGPMDADFARHANLADQRVNNLCRRDSPRWIPCIPTVSDGSIITDHVGKYTPNAWGLHDMHGNVCEWTRTTYRPYPYDAGDGRDNLTPDGRKVVRGGSFYDRPQRGRSAFRLSYPSWQAVYNVGFRVVCQADAKALLVKTAKAGK